MNEEPLSNAVEGGYNVNFYPLRLPGSVYGNYLLGGAIPASIPVVGVQPFAPNPYSMFALRGGGPPKYDDDDDDYDKSLSSLDLGSKKPHKHRLTSLESEIIQNDRQHLTTLEDKKKERAKLDKLDRTGKGMRKKKSLINHVIKLLNF